MKKIKLILFYVIAQQFAFSQTIYSKIQISDDIELIKISENSYVHVSYYELPGSGRFPSNGLILINDSNAVLFDTPMTDSLTRILVSYLIDKMRLNITAFIPNHWHSDCMGGLEYIHALGIESYANQATIDICKIKNLPVPKNAFIDSLELQLGSIKIYCYFLGPAHSLDNIVTWIPSENILFAGCMIKSLNSPNLGNTADGDLKEYPKTIDKVLAKFPSANIVIPGHGAFGNIELIKHTKILCESHKN